MNDIKKAIDILNTYWDSLIDTGLIDCETLCQCVNVLEEKLNGGWTPISEGTPKEKGEYLVTYHPCYWERIDKELLVGTDTFRGKVAWAKKKYQSVVAWMPLPEEYKE